MFSQLQAWLLRSYMRTPEHWGKYRIVRWLGRNLFPDNGIWCRAHPDVQLALHPRDWIEYLLLRGIAYEPRTLEFVAGNLAEGDVALFAGVNFGLHVAVAARAVGASGTVIGVEPQPKALLRAAENLRKNGMLERVLLVHAALGSADGFAAMAWSAPENPGAASLLDSGTGFVTPIVRLSRVIEAVAPKPLRLLLLDVQGFEAPALAGLDPAQVPEIMIVELDPEFLRRAKVTADDLFVQMAALGYDLHSLDGTRATSEATDLPERNLIAVKPGVRVVWRRASIDNSDGPVLSATL